MVTVPAGPPTRERILSLDVFRGLTILVMVFVNDVSGVKGLPWWTYHIPPGENGMTYVDVVYPAFLFIVGMAIPLALGARLRRGESVLHVWRHILIRTVSLVALGLLIMNGRQVSPEETGVSYAFWNVTMLVAAILFWNVYPKAEGKKANLFNRLRWGSLGALIVLLVIYRRVDDGAVVWIDPENWSILGGIGWAYLSVCLLYFVLGKRTWPLVGALAALVLLNVLHRAGIVGFLTGLPKPIWPFGSGGAASIVMAGLVLSMLFGLGPDTRFKAHRAWWGAGFGMILFLTGWLLLPFGLAKIGATPSWCLFSAGIGVVLFLLLYWVIDVRGYRRWTAPMAPAGSNALLTYLLPDIFYAAIGWKWLAPLATAGLPGVFRSLLFTAFILAWATLMTRWKFRMQL